MKTHHTFIDRNYILFKAIEAWQIDQDKCLTLEDKQILSEFGLKESALSGSPGWLQKWASYICEYIKFEEAQYPIVFREDYPNVKEEFIKLDAKNMRDVKLSNVAITIDKVKHVLECMENTNEPPLRKLTSSEVFTRLWYSDDSFKQSLIEVLNAIENQFAEDVDYCFDYIKSIDEKLREIPSDLSEEEREI